MLDTTLEVGNTLQNLTTPELQRIVQNLMVQSENNTVLLNRMNVRKGRKTLKQVCSTAIYSNCTNLGIHFLQDANLDDLTENSAEL